MPLVQSASTASAKKKSTYSSIRNKRLVNVLQALKDAEGRPRSIYRFKKSSLSILEEKETQASL